MLQKSNASEVPPCKLPGYKSPVYYSALCKGIFVRIWIFLSINLKKYRNRLHSSKDLRVALCNCVPGYERIISEKQQKVTRFVCNEQ